MVKQYKIDGVNLLVDKLNAKKNTAITEIKKNMFLLYMIIVALIVNFYKLHNFFWDIRY